MTPLQRLILQHPSTLAVPVAVYPGLHLLPGRTIRQMVTDPSVQTACAQAIQQRYRTPVMLSAMDLSAEAEAFGATIRLDEHEVPTVLGRLVSDPVGVQALGVPPVGTARTAVHLETVRRLATGERAKPIGERALVLGGHIGPFSLAGRLWGVSEFLELTATDPDLAIQLIDLATTFLIAYVGAFKRAGADGVLMAEPTAGLLSPKGLGKFSSPFVRKIITSVEDATFGVVLHNCGAKAPHLPQVLESGASAYHFGQPMDLVAALAQVRADQLVCGNLDPAGVFVGGTPATISERVNELLARHAGQRNFVLSSGCDVPPNAPLANLDAFFARFIEDQRRTACRS